MTLYGPCRKTRSLLYNRYFQNRTTMIDTLPYYLLQAEETDTAAERLIALVQESLPAEPLLQPIFTLIGKDRAALQLALANSPGSALTRKIAEADEVRDDAFLVLRNHCDNATRRRTKPDFIAAGELLLRLIRTQGYTLQQFGNTSETGALNALFKSLEAADAAAALHLIGADELLAELEAAQSSFEEIINARNDEQAAKDYPLVASAKTTLGKRLQMLLSFIGTLDTADVANARPELDTLIARLNEVTAEILAPARARRTRGNAPDAPVVTPPAPNP
jgi:hypothetical protein